VGVLAGASEDRLWAWEQAVAKPQAAPSPRPATPAAPAPGAYDHEVAAAAAARKAGRLDEAVGHYRKALQLKPSWTEGRWDLASILYDLDRYDEARTALRSVLAAEPKQAVALALLGLCEFQLKDYTGALAHLGAARLLGIPNDEVAAVADFHTAILLNRTESFEGAFDILRAFAGLNKDTPGVIEAIGLSQLRLPYLPGEAPAEKREMILMAGRAGYLMAQNRRSASARAAFEELASRFPTAPNVHYAFGTCLVPEDPDMALEEFEREIRQSPGHYLSMLRIALEQLKRGHPEVALPRAQKALELAPNLFAARLIMGRVLLETGETAEATVHLEKAAELAPDSPEACFSLARAYQKEGREEDAKRMRTRFLTLSREQQARTKGADSVGGIIPPESPDSPSDKGSLP
jgi:tetratricopeptide (TPR) repeat protein